MRWRVFALFSLGLNIVLGALWLAVPARLPSRSQSPGTALSQTSAGASRTNLVLRRRLFSWHELEAADYPTFIANLREIGCPEQTIRDIIIADVNALYARKQATELVTPQQQWWRTEPDTNVLQVAAVKTRALEDERRMLLVELLGPGWESGDLANIPRPTHPGILLDGPVLGTLPAETKQSLQEIHARSEERLQAYMDSLQGKNANPVELAKLRQQTRDELARVLAPGPLEEFLLRYSQQANNLRAAFGQLQFFDPTPDEFRAVFRATDSLDQRLEMFADSTDPNAIQARRALEAQRENAIKVALGPQRYEEYQNLADPLYRDAVATARASDMPEAARTIYELNLANQVQKNVIQSDPNMSADQKAVALKQAELDQLKAHTVAKGQDLPPEAVAPVTPPRPSYVLRQGDTPAVVAMIYGVPEQAIRAANPGVDFNRLRPGQSINLPGSTLTPIRAPNTPYR